MKWREELPRALVAHIALHEYLAEIIREHTVVVNDRSQQSEYLTEDIYHKISLFLRVVRHDMFVMLFALGRLQYIDGIGNRYSSATEQVGQEPVFVMKNRRIVDELNNIFNSRNGVRTKIVDTPFGRRYRR